jgi:hypothetical protein
MRHEMLHEQGSEKEDQDRREARASRDQNGRPQQGLGLGHFR